MAAESSDSSSEYSNAEDYTDVVGTTGKVLHHHIFSKAIFDLSRGTGSRLSGTTSRRGKYTRECRSVGD
jgi:hypothetical protein